MTNSAVRRPPTTPYRSRLPRLTGRAMTDLLLWMLGFGLIIGVAFPFALLPFQIPAREVLRPDVFAVTILAGLLVGGANYRLATSVVGVRLHVLVAAMRMVDEALVDASRTGDWAEYDPSACQIPVDSDDQLGDVARSFNKLTDSLAASHRVSEGIAAVGDALAAHIDLEELATDTLRALAGRTDCQAAALLSVSQGRIEVVGSVGIADTSSLSSDRAVVRAAAGGSATNLILPADVVISAAIIDVIPQHVRVLPLRFGVLTVGVLVVAFASPCAPEATAIVDAIVPSLAVALNNAITHRDLQQVAALDALTGLYNRRFGLQRLKEEFARSLRSGDPISILMLDIDHFKSVNDTYGHLVGDRVLQRVVVAARHVLREGDVLMRYGGEEFLAILPGAGYDDRAQMAERVRRAVADADITEGAHRIQVTVSVGGAGIPDQTPSTIEDLIGQADSALYTAKASGRDRCVLAA